MTRRRHILPAFGVGGEPGSLAAQLLVHEGTLRDRQRCPDRVGRVVAQEREDLAISGSWAERDGVSHRRTVTQSFDIDAWARAVGLESPGAM